MNQKNWKQRFTDEFGIHFSASELQFVLAFIEEEIGEAYERGHLAEIEANATADITIAQDKAEQIRAEVRKEERAFILNVLEDAVNKAKEAERKEYRESIIPALCEDARRRERDRIWHEHLGLGKDIREVLSN